MSSLMSLEYRSLGYPVMPEYANPLYPSFKGQSRAEHLAAGCHFIYPGLSSFKQQPSSPQEREMLKYSPYYPFFGVKRDDEPSAFRPHQPTAKPTLEQPSPAYQDRQICTCNCTLTPSRALTKHPMCAPEYYNWFFPSDRFSHSADELPIGYRLSSLTTRPYPMFSRRLNENEKRPTPKRFQCPHCEKSFGKSSHLRDHIRTHTGDRPYRCQYCDKAFTQYSNLRTHTRIHTGERPYRCTHCSKSFTQAVTLRSHTRTHLGEKAYHCKQCAKSFACFSGLKGHIRMHDSAQATAEETRSDGTEVTLSIKQEVEDDNLPQDKN